MRLLALDYEPVYEGVLSATFNSDVSIFDYDAVIWDPAASLAYYKDRQTRTYRSLLALSESMSVRIQADVKRRREEFHEFLNVGRIIVVVVRPQQTCYVDNGKREHSGTGRNRLTTRFWDDFDLLWALPVSKSGFTRASGTKIEFSGDGPGLSHVHCT